MQENSGIVFLIVCAIAEQNLIRLSQKKKVEKNHMFVVEENERLFDLLGLKSCFGAIVKQGSVSKGQWFDSQQKIFFNLVVFSFCFFFFNF
jgi:hypothetical protein